MEPQQQDDKKFSKLVKRIWDGPAEEGDEFSSLEAPGVYDPPVEQQPRQVIRPAEQPVYRAEQRAPERPPEGYAPRPEHYVARSAEPVGETTVIARGAVITGDLICEGGVDMFGAIKGNIASKGDVRITGRLEGNLQAENVTMSGCAIQGNMNISGAVMMDGDSVLVGDVNAENMTTDGRVKGNVTTRGGLTMQSGAYLLGDINAGNINMVSGARINGRVQVADEQADDIQFP